VNKITELTSCVCIIIITISLISLISEVKATLANHVTEYQYKDWSDKDISLAMKYHGIQSVTVTEFEAYFVDKNNNKCTLFTDSCIDYIIKTKQRSEK